MKRFAALVGLVLLVALPMARAQQNPDDQYIAIYNLMQQADTLQANGQPREALADYTQALAGLQKLQKVFPYWEPEIVTYRLNYLTDKINGLAAQLPPLPQNGVAPATNAVPAARVRGGVGGAIERVARAGAGIAAGQRDASGQAQGSPARAAGHRGHAGTGPGAGAGSGLDEGK